MNMLSFLCPLSVPSSHESALSRFARNAIFDRNVIRLVSQCVGPVPVAARIERDWETHIRPVRFNRFSRRLTLAVHDVSHCVFVAEARFHRIQKFHPDGTPLLRWGSRGKGDGQFQRPSDVAVHPAFNLVFVTDDFNHRIQVFSSDGVFIRKWGVHGRAEGEFRYPCSIAVHPTKHLVYVGDYENSRIQVFTVEGDFLLTWDCLFENRRFGGPFRLTLHHTRDLIFVSAHNRVHAFQRDGTFLFQVRASVPPEFLFLKHIAIHHRRELLLLADAGDHRIQVFDLHGNYLSEWRWTPAEDCTTPYHPTRCRPCSRRPFSRVNFIAVDAFRDLVYVCDDTAHRVQTLSLHTCLSHAVTTQLN